MHLHDDRAGDARVIAGHAAARVSVPLGAGAPLTVWAVPDLERLVDRGAVLRGEQEPPYWAYLWSGARLLGAYVARGIACRGLRALEIGCGLGVPGLAAARGGAAVTFLDAVPAALAFVRASAAANGFACDTVVGDFRAAPVGQVDLVLAAEVVYDASAYDALADLFVRHLRPGGLGLVADGFRTDTRAFYRALDAHGLHVWSLECRVPEEGRDVSVRISEIRRRR
jgi:predicted nicotinamide N-methyase